MTRSVEELKRESERNRQALAATTDRLKEQLSQTADDLRRTVSPQHIKSEVSDYISDTTQGWVQALKRQAMENPMQAVAAGTAIAVPMIRLVRAFPLPILMMGAGLALTSSSVRARASSAVAPAMDKGSDMLNQVVAQSQSIAGNMRDGLSSAQDEATGMFGDVRDRAASLTGDVSSRITDTAATISGNVSDTVDQVRNAASSALEGGRNYAAAAPEKARGVIRDNAALIGGIGIAIGAVIAAALPKTSVEAKAMGAVSDSMKQAAGDAARAGFDTVQDTARSAADAAQKSVAEADLAGHASRMTQNLGDAVKDAAQDAVSAAYNPSRTQNT
jgi:gas vesicle protein